MLPLMRNTADPSLTLNFASGSLDSRISFSRASAGTYFDKTGTLQSAVSGVPRFDWGSSPGATPLGLLIEPSATNSIQNNTNVGAVAGTPGTDPTNAFTYTALTGLTKTIVGFGTVNGQPYIDYQISGTASGAGLYSFYPGGAVVAALGDTWTYSASLAIVGGSQSNITSITMDVSELVSGAFLAYTVAPKTVTATLTKFSVSRLFNQATVNQCQVEIDLNIAAAGAVNITLRIAGQQLEKGLSGATSLILTSGSAVTRAADNATMPVGAWFNLPASSFCIEYDAAAPANAGVAGGFAGAAFTDAIYLVANTLTANIVSQTTINMSNGAMNGAGVLNKAAAAYDLGSVRYALNGAAPSSASLVGTANWKNTLGIGCDPWDGAGAVNGHVKRLRYWRRALSSSELQTVST